MTALAIAPTKPIATSVATFLPLNGAPLIIDIGSK
jgi:hypothetical protein